VNNTEYNRIDTNGYSLFGYTTSQGAYKLQVNGTIYASGSIIGNITGNVTGTVTTSSNVAGGTAGQLVYQSAPGITGFAGPGTSGQLLVSAGASAPVYTNTASIYVNSARYSDNITAGTTGQLVYQSAANTTAFVGPGTSGQLLVSAGASAPVYTTTSTIQVGYAANILAGTTGQLVYQSASNTTGFVGPGTAGQFLQSAGAGAPTYVSTGTMYVQRAVQADSAVGGAGSVANALTISTGLSGSPSTSYNGSAAITLTLNTATLMASAVQVSNSLSAGTGLTGSAFNGSTAQTWTLNTATLIANSVSASTATNAGTAYATIASHSAGTGLTGSAFNGSTAQTWTLNTATLMASSVAIAGGTTGQLVYQSAANTTGFVGPGTAGQFLQSAGAGAPTYVSTSTMYVQRAVQADSASGASGSVANALTFNNGGSGSASGSTFNGSAAVTISYNSIGAPLASQLTNGAANGTAYNSIVSLDSRAVNYAPGDRSSGFFADFKQNSTDGLSDGGNYHGVLTFRPYGTSNSDFSGGQAQQIGTTDNNNLWHRISSSSSTWGTWYKIIDTNNTSTALINSSVNIAGGTAGQLHYQSAASTTGFVGPGTAGQFLQSAGTSAPTYVSTTTMYVQRAVQADSASAGAGYTGNINATANTNAFEYIVGVSASGSTSAAATVATTNPVGFNASTGQVNIGGTTAYGNGRLVVNARTNPTTTTDSNNQIYIGEPSQNSVYYLNVGYLNINSTYAGSIQSIAGGSGAQLILNGAGGSVGIGTTNPVYKLHVAGANTTGTPLVHFNATGTGAFQRGVQLFNSALAAGESIMYSVGTADSSRQMGQMYYYYAGSNSTSNRLSFGLHSVDDVINILGSGNVSIGTTTDQGSKLGVLGEIRATSEITAYYSSDINLKENIRLIADPLKKLEQIRGVYFDWTDEHIKSRGGEDGYFVRKQDVGVIAQEVEAVLPEIVATQDNGTKAVRYEKLVPLLVEAIKEQQQQIAQLQQLVNQLVNK
jgi:hypothetical protein